MRNIALLIICALLLVGCGKDKTPTRAATLVSVTAATGEMM